MLNSQHEHFANHNYLIQCQDADLKADKNGAKGGPKVS